MKKKVLIIVFTLCLLVGCGKKEEEKNLLDPSDVLEATEQSKIHIAEDISYSLRQETKMFYLTWLMDNGSFEKTTFICNGKECSNGTEQLDLSGNIPSSGSITIDVQGEMIFSNIVIDGYKCNIPNSGNITCSK